VSAWISGPFYKVVCKATDEEFARAKAVDDSVVLRESGLGGIEITVAFRPREVWPKAFRFLLLYQ
jgi:hypothetical protein